MIAKMCRRAISSVRVPINELSCCRRLTSSSAAGDRAKPARCEFMMDARVVAKNGRRDLMH
jgi:hypothetical protein